MSVEENIKRLRGQSLMEYVLFTLDIVVFCTLENRQLHLKTCESVEFIRKEAFLGIFLCGMFRFNMRGGHSCTLMKVFSHPSHAYSKCYITGNWTCFIHIQIYSM